MKSLCIFVHYSEEDYIPINVIHYINELKKFFTDILIVSNYRNIKNIHELNNKKILLFNNEGYDFGFFYKAINSIDIDIYDRIGFVNDSNIIINSLDSVFNWGNNSNLDFWGLTNSYEKILLSKEEYSFISDINKHHIQSHFLVFNKKAVNYLYQFFKDIKFVDFLSNKYNIRELKLRIIEKCEIGLSQYLKNKDLKIGSMYDIKNYATDYKIKNIHFSYWKELIKNGYPLVKKKILYDTFDVKYEKEYVEKYNIDLNDKYNYINKYKNKNIKI